MMISKAMTAAAMSLAVTMPVALAACSQSARSGGGSGGVLRIGTSYPIDSLNPFVAQSDYSYMAFEYIYPQLVQYNAKLDIVPDFATSWTTSPDGLTWTFHTQPHAKWSDGRPLTAEDAAWTINSVLKD